SVARRLLVQLIEKLLHLIGGTPSLPFFELLVMRTTIDIQTEGLITRRRQRAVFTFLVEFGPDGKARWLADIFIFFADQFLHQLACFFWQLMCTVAGELLLRQEPGVPALIDGFGLTHAGFPATQSARTYSQSLVPTAGAIS